LRAWNLDVGVEICKTDQTIHPHGCVGFKNACRDWMHADDEEQQDYHDASKPPQSDH